MKTLIASLLLFVSTLALATEMLVPIVSVTDGDTIRSQLSLPCPLCNVSIRIRDIDTPEKGGTAKCTKERTLGIAATDFIKELIGSNESMIIRDIRWDKFGGRIVAYVFIDGVDIGQTMILKGHAKFYDGTGPKPDWCN